MFDLPSTVASSCESAKLCLIDRMILSLPGLDPDIIANALAQLNIDPVVESATADASAAVESATPSMEATATQMGKESNYKKKESVERRIAASHANQDAKKSIKISEPVPAEKGVSGAVKDQKDPDYSTELSYPFSYGMVDEANNWYRVNQETGEAQFAHESGSFLKIDKVGNVTIKITGSLKFIVDKDSLFQTQNHTEVIKSNYYRHVFGTEKVLVDKTLGHTSVGVHTLKGSKINLN